MEFFKQLTDDHADFIAKQPIFFVATAAQEARINLSPKGMDSFRVFDPKCVGYLDMGGSGNETHAHLAADGRITIMFCAFAQPALILRLYGRGRVVLPQDAEWDKWVQFFDPLPGVRQIFVIELDSIQTSCGWGVPIMTLERERTTLTKYHASGDPEERLEKVKDRTKSIDGLPIRAPTQVARFTTAK
jgi:Pyridoxamine 5'-phosphate oxidase